MLRYFANAFRTWSPFHFIFDGVLTVMASWILKNLTDMSLLGFSFWTLMILLLVTSFLKVFVPQFGGQFWREGRIWSDRNKYEKTKIKPKPRAKESELKVSSINEKAFDVLQVPRDGVYIKDKTFVNCDIHGPSILVIQGGTTIAGRSDFTIRSNSKKILWEWDGEEPLVGPVVLQNCKLIDCHFFDIGLMFSKDVITAAQKLIPDSGVIHLS